ncbi:MAG: dihydroxyacetone kinase subunit L [Acidobacteriia bacterium]|nr:dihydroxyacetone kinase subunit L [Terriglobia bacterium]
MGTSFTLKEARSWINTAAADIEKNSSLLGDLDAAIGDGDHGDNMARGFTAVVKKLDTGSFAELGALFKTVGMTLLSTVGGAAGPLYGGFFLTLGKQSAGKTELDTPGLATALEAGVQDIKHRGKAVLGDKTMVDALTPALAAFKSSGDSLPAATRAAAETAADAAEKTSPLLARKGRASYLGERSIGHKDPGAASSAILLQALAKVCARA